MLSWGRVSDVPYNTLNVLLRALWASAQLWKSCTYKDLPWGEFTIYDVVSSTTSCKANKSDMNDLRFQRSLRECCRSYDL